MIRRPGKRSLSYSPENIVASGRDPLRGVVAPIGHGYAKCFGALERDEKKCMHFFARIPL